MAKPLTDSDAWEHVVNLATKLVILGKQIERQGGGRDVWTTAGTLQGFAVRRLELAESNARSVRSNPPEGVALGKRFSDRVYGIQYKHRDDGKDYQHPFKAGVQLWKANIGGHDAVVILGAHGQPITEEF